MARIVEEMIVIKVSKIVRDDTDSSATILPEEFALGIEAMATEILADPTAIVEVYNPNAQSDE